MFKNAASHLKITRSHNIHWRNIVNEITSLSNPQKCYQPQGFYSICYYFDVLNGRTQWWPEKDFLGDWFTTAFKAITGFRCLWLFCFPFNSGCADSIADQCDKSIQFFFLLTNQNRRVAFFFKDINWNKSKNALQYSTSSKLHGLWGCITITKLSSIILRLDMSFSLNATSTKQTLIDFTFSFPL